MKCEECKGVGRVTRMEPDPLSRPFGLSRPLDYTCTSCNGSGKQPSAVAPDTAAVLEKPAFYSLPLHARPWVEWAAQRLATLEADLEHALVLVKTLIERSDKQAAALRAAEAQVQQLTEERDQARTTIGWVNNEVFGSHAYFVEPDCVIAVREMKAEVQRLREREQQLVPTTQLVAIAFEEAGYSKDEADKCAVSLVATYLQQQHPSPREEAKK